MRAFQAVCVLSGLLVVNSAGALEQVQHRRLTKAVCEAFGFEQGFCRALAVHTANVDFHEWDKPVAHAQKALATQSLCEAANAAVKRMGKLGRIAQTALRKLETEQTAGNANAVAIVLGRALHTIQDACAHDGMHNDQHAWGSRLESCEGGGGHSPDLAPAALDCAKAQTEAVFRSLKAQVERLPKAAKSLGMAETQRSRLPPGNGVCKFLDEAAEWDGRDGRWNGARVTPILSAQVIAFMTQAEPEQADVCSEGPNAIDPVQTYPVTVVTKGPANCFKLKAYCSLFRGKSDGPDDVPPPWSGAHSPAAEGGGCAAAGSTTGWLAIALLILFRRRQR